ncbi:MAG: carboxypeptidase regulatory-like domain-containing protein, partial [Gemmatimonadetes bacterium]|nr:carboxypeptidase regulatory-like domain-containing protein [Gemmatimonadota bacterium]
MSRPSLPTPCTVARHSASAIALAWAIALACTLAVTLTGSGAAAQIPTLPDSVEQAIVGVLIDDSDGRPIPAASVTLLRGPSTLSTVTTDDEGRFRMPVPLPGFYRLGASRIGYVPTESQLLEIETGVILTVEYRILPDAILMEPILVTARSDQGRSIFEDRRQEWGRGLYLTPEMVDSINPRHHPGEVFRGQEDVWLSWGTARVSSG